MAAVLITNPLIGETYESGDKLYIYDAGTSDDRASYTTAALSVAHAQPQIADSSGRFAGTYIDATGGDIKIKVTDSSDVERFTEDNIPINDLTTVSSSVTTNTSDITAIDGRMTVAESEIDTLQTESTDYESRISTNETDIAALQSGSLTAFTATLAVPGTIAFPTTSGGDDFIMKFQTISVGADTTATMTWDTAFPNNCLFAVASFASEIDDQNDASANVYALTSTQATVQNTAGVTETISVLAIGY